MASEVLLGCGLHRTIKLLCLLLVALTYLLIYVIQHSVIKVRYSYMISNRISNTIQSRLDDELKFYFGTTHFPISMLVLQFQKPTLQNVTVIPNGPSSALPAFYSSSSPTSSRVSQVVGSTLETWFRTNLNATPCHSTSLPFLTTSTKEEDKGKS